MSKVNIIDTKRNLIVETLDTDDWQCAGITGAQPINESCGGCVGCMIAQAVHCGMEVEDVKPNSLKFIEGSEYEEI